MRRGPPLLVPPPLIALRPRPLGSLLWRPSPPWACLLTCRRVCALGPNGPVSGIYPEETTVSNEAYQYGHGKGSLNCVPWGSGPLAGTEPWRRWSPARVLYCFGRRLDIAPRTEGNSPNPTHVVCILRHQPGRVQEERAQHSWRGCVGAAGGAGRAAGGWGPCLLPGGSEKAFGAAELLKYPDAPWKSPGVCVESFLRRGSSLPAAASGRVSLVEPSEALYLVGALGPPRRDGIQGGVSSRLLELLLPLVGARWPSSQMPGSECVWTECGLQTSCLFLP